MTSTREEHLTFWRTIAGNLKKGAPLVKALQEAKSALAGTSFERLAPSLRGALEDGSPLYEALASHSGFFSRR